MCLSSCRAVTFGSRVAGGRAVAQFGDGDGRAVLEKNAKVMTMSGSDVTAAFLKGANEALAFARERRCRLAILTEKSPSCGSSLIYDGTFSSRLRQGRGVTAELLEENGVRVFNQHQVEQAAEYLLEIERSEVDEPRRS